MKEVGDGHKNFVINWEYYLGYDSLDSIKIKYKHDDGKLLSYALKKKGNHVQLNRNDANDRDNQNLIIEADDISVARITLKNVLFKFDHNTKFICTIITVSGNLITSEVTLIVYGIYYLILFYLFIL